MIKFKHSGRLRALTPLQQGIAERFRSSVNNNGSIYNKDCSKADLMSVQVMHQGKLKDVLVL